MKPNLYLCTLFCLAVATCAAQQAPLTITTPSPLPAATVGQAYTVTFAASGGTPSYSWTAPQGLPAGLSLDKARAPCPVHRLSPEFLPNSRFRSPTLHSRCT